MQLDGEGFCIRICAIRWLFTTYICIYVSMWELSLGNNILWVGENRRQRLGKGCAFLLAARHLEKCKFNCIECN